MKIAYFDCFSGAAGDMIVGALLDAGADADALREGLSNLGVSGFSLSVQRVDKQSLAATRFCVQLDPDLPQPHRHLRHILEILDASTLSDRVRGKAAQIFRRLAEAEAKVHGTTIEKIHFH